MMASWDLVAPEQVEAAAAALEDLARRLREDASGQRLARELEVDHHRTYTDPSRYIRPLPGEPTLVLERLTVDLAWAKARDTPVIAPGS